MQNHTEESPSLHDLHSDAGVTIIPLSDEAGAPHWRGIESAIIAEQEYRETHCGDCGNVTAGTIVGGIHHQQCDGCLRAALVETLALIDAQAA